MKHKIIFYYFSFLLTGFLLATANTPAQTIGYRQTNLASSLPTWPTMWCQPWSIPGGIAFLPASHFSWLTIESEGSLLRDASGLVARPGGFTMPNATGTGFDHPTGIVADQNSSFGTQRNHTFHYGHRGRHNFHLGPGLTGRYSASGNSAFSRASAVFKGVAILNSPWSVQRWRSPISMLDLFESSFRSIRILLPWRLRVPLRIRICLQVSRRSGFK